MFFQLRFPPQKMLLQKMFFNPILPRKCFYAVFLPRECCYRKCFSTSSSQKCSQPDPPRKMLLSSAPSQKKLLQKMFFFQPCSSQKCFSTWFSPENVSQPCPFPKNVATDNFLNLILTGKCFSVLLSPENAALENVPKWSSPENICQFCSFPENVFQPCSSENVSQPFHSPENVAAENFLNLILPRKCF